MSIMKYYTFLKINKAPLEEHQHHCFQFHKHFNHVPKVPIQTIKSLNFIKQVIIINLTDLSGLVLWHNLIMFQILSHVGPSTMAGIWDGDGEVHMQPIFNMIFGKIWRKANHYHKTNKLKEKKKRRQKDILSLLLIWQPKLTSINYFKPPKNMFCNRCTAHSQLKAQSHRKQTLITTTAFISHHGNLEAIMKLLISDNTPLHQLETNQLSALHHI